jgi:hypothetical protein
MGVLAYPSGVYRSNPMYCAWTSFKHSTEEAAAPGTKILVFADNPVHVIGIAVNDPHHLVRDVDELLSSNTRSLGETSRKIYVMLHLACGIITWRRTGLLK